MREIKKYLVLSEGLMAVAMLVGFIEPVFSQTKTATTTASTSTETDAGTRLGVGVDSRFGSGSIPIRIERQNILPGSPMNVKPTMDNLVPTSGKNVSSFGGILGRYDTSQFGKFFASGSLAAQAAIPQRAASSLNNLSMGDNLVDNSQAKIARMYPPRLYVDHKEYPVSNLETSQVRINVENQIKNFNTRYGLSSQQVQVTPVYQQGALVLQGRVYSTHLARMLVDILYLEPGVEKIVNELVVTNPTAPPPDPLAVSPR